MEKIYPVFEIIENKVSHPIIEEFQLASGLKIAALIIGERGRGRELGILPVEGAQPGEELRAASIGKTRSGRPKLIARPEPNTNDAVIVVLRTPIGFRGNNKHCGKTEQDPFPGNVLTRGIIAQGAAGRMGSGDQLIALVPKGKVWSIHIGGRRYGAPHTYYYTFDGHRIKVAIEDDVEKLGLEDVLGLVDFE